MSHSTVALVKGLDRYQNIAQALGLLGEEAISGTRYVVKPNFVSTEVQLLHMLALARIDITIGTDPNISYDIARLGYREQLEATAWQPSKKTELFIAFSRKSPALGLSRRIEETLRQWLSDGTVDRIIRAYQ